MKSEKTKLADFWLGQLNKFGVPAPETYTLEELIALNPSVPQDFIRDHITKRQRTNK